MGLTINFSHGCNILFRKMYLNPLRRQLQSKRSNRPVTLPTNILRYLQTSILTPQPWTVLNMSQSHPDSETSRGDGQRAGGPSTQSRKQAAKLSFTFSLSSLRLVTAICSSADMKSIPNLRQRTVDPTAFFGVEGASTHSPASN